MEFATLAWADWFNNRRLLEPIGNIPPAEAEAAYSCLRQTRGGSRNRDIADFSATNFLFWWDLE